MVVFNAVYKKNDGTKRKIKFARLEDLPQAKNLKPRKLADGSELVWDIQKNSYRVFNWNTVVGKVIAQQV